MTYFSKSLVCMTFLMSQFVSVGHSTEIGAFNVLDKIDEIENSRNSMLSKNILDIRAVLFSGGYKKAKTESVKGSSFETLIMVPDVGDLKIRKLPTKNINGKSVSCVLSGGKKDLAYATRVIVKETKDGSFLTELTDGYARAYASCTSKVAMNTADGKLDKNLTLQEIKDYFSPPQSEAALNLLASSLGGESYKNTYSHSLSSADFFSEKEIQRRHELLECMSYKVPCDQQKTKANQ